MFFLRRLVLVFFTVVVYCTVCSCGELMKKLAMTMCAVYSMQKYKS